MEQSDDALAELSDIDGKQKKEGNAHSSPYWLPLVNAFKGKLLPRGEPDTGEGCDLGKLRSDSRII